MQTDSAYTKNKYKNVFSSLSKSRWYTYDIYK